MRTRTPAPWTVATAVEIPGAGTTTVARPSYGFSSVVMTMPSGTLPPENRVRTSTRCGPP